MVLHVSFIFNAYLSSYLIHEAVFHSRAVALLQVRKHSQTTVVFQKLKQIQACQSLSASISSSLFAFVICFEYKGWKTKRAHFGVLNMASFLEF